MQINSDKSGKIHILALYVAGVKAIVRHKANNCFAASNVVTGFNDFFTSGRKRDNFSTHYMS